jgi:hypothetical protein
MHTRQMPYTLDHLRAAKQDLSVCWALSWHTLTPGVAAESGCKVIQATACKAASLVTQYWHYDSSKPAPLPMAYNSFSFSVPWRL